MLAPAGGRAAERLASAPGERAGGVGGVNPLLYTARLSRGAVPAAGGQGTGCAVPPGGLRTGSCPARRCGALPHRPRRFFPFCPAADWPGPPWGRRSPRGWAEPGAAAPRPPRPGPIPRRRQRDRPRLLGAWLHLPSIGVRLSYFSSGLVGSGRRAGSASLLPAGSGASGRRRMSKGREGPAAGGE